MDDTGPRVAEFLTFGDSSGNLVLYKNREPVFHDQVTYAQVVALRFLDVSLTLAMMTSDGILKLCRLSPLSRRLPGSNNQYELISLSSMQTFEQLNNQLKLRQIGLRSSICLQAH